MMMFHDMADEIFRQAGVPKAGNEGVWDQVVSILNACMAQLSVTHGLSYDRVTLFDQQKEALLHDLLDMKEKGLL